MPIPARRLPAALGAVAPLLLLAAPPPALAAAPIAQLAAQTAIDACGVVRRVRKVVVETLGIDKAEVTLAARLREDLGADSLDMVALAQALEAGFAIEIADVDCAGVSTVGDAVALVERRLGETYGAPDGC
jgi:acyl carrier protein